MNEAASRVLSAPREDAGGGQHACPGDELRGVVDRGGKVAAHVELATDPQQNRDLTRLGGGVHRVVSFGAGGRLDGFPWRETPAPGRRFTHRPLVGAARWDGRRQGDATSRPSSMVVQVLV